MVDGKIVQAGECTIWSDHSLLGSICMFYSFLFIKMEPYQFQKAFWHPICVVVCRTVHVETDFEVLSLLGRTERYLGSYVIENM